MLQEEFERMTGSRDRDEYEKANAVYMALPYLNKDDFCLLWGITGGRLLEFAQVKSIAETVERAPRLLGDLDERLRGMAQTVRAELAKPENWTERTRRAARAAVAAAGKGVAR